MGKLIYRVGLAILALLAIANIVNGQVPSDIRLSMRHFRNEATGDTIVTSVTFNKYGVPIMAEVQKKTPLIGKSDLIDDAPIEDFRSSLVSLNRLAYWRYTFKVRDKQIEAFAPVRRLEEAKQIMSLSWDYFLITDADPMDNTRPIRLTRL